MCLDAFAFGRGLFAPDDARWFDAGPMLQIARQTRQALAPDVMLLPLLGWMSAWWAAHRGTLPKGSRPAKVLKAAFEEPALVAAASELVSSLATVGSALALRIDGAEQWLGWAAGAAIDEAGVDEADAEDVFTYLAALLHRLPADSLGALFVRMPQPIDGDAGAACAPLLNAARHFGWVSVFCAEERQPRPEGFDAVAAWITDPAFWCGQTAAAPSQPLLCGEVPAHAPPQPLLAMLATLRQTEETRR